MGKVSVIMPCFNHARFLKESVRGILGQSYANLELIIVDDCSSDSSWQLIRMLADSDLRIKAIRHDRNQGASKSRNAGLRVAAGEFIGFCDADDIWNPEKLEVQVSLLQSNLDYGVTYCDTLIIDEAGVPTGQRFSDLFPPAKNRSGRLFQELLVRNFVNIQGVLMRAECIRRAGYFDEGIKWVEDWWYWIRIARYHRFLYSPRPLAKYRLHSRSTNLVHKRGYCLNRFKVFRRILRDYADLRRTAKADIAFRMGVDLCELGKFETGRRLLWSVFRSSLTDWRGLSCSCKALRRLLISTTTPPRHRC